MHSYRPSQSLAYGMRLMRSPGGTWGVRYQDISGLRRTIDTVSLWLVSAPTATGCCSTQTSGLRSQKPAVFLSPVSAAWYLWLLADKENQQ